MDAPSCKICGSPCEPFCEADFARTCGVEKGPRPAPTGELAPYVRCGGCGLIFTAAFDAWTEAEFQARIYNEGYLEADPDYLEKRPASFAQGLAGEFAAVRQTLRVLDYGGGNGRQAQDLRSRGFDCETYDPMTPAFAERPAGGFGLVTCIETFEHLPDPRGTVREIVSFLQEPGLALFTTLLQPPDVDPSWWYLAPRNGHITLYTRKALALLWGEFGYRCATLAPNLHIAFKTPPAWASRLISLAD